jgi:methionine synthase / methylenetetrahydrofolate reductase(NADPH)
MINFKSALKKESSILFDGAIGTELYKRGLFINRCFEQACLSDQSLVMQIHKDYHEAGAQVITTNTWGANRKKLEGFGLGKDLIAINKNAVSLAQQAAKKAWIAGSIGPLGVQIEPLGKTSCIEAQDIFAEQITCLLDAKVDLIIFETFSNPKELQQAIYAAKKINSEIAIVATLTSSQTPNYNEIFNCIDFSSIDVFGVNCSVGPHFVLKSLEAFTQKVSNYLIAQPNAGLPREVDGRKIYMCTPEYMAQFAQDCLQLGVKIVGGCCGTTPDHIKVMANAMRHSSHQIKEDKKEFSFSEDNNTKKKIVAFADKSSWSKKISENKMVYSVEMLPPQGFDTSALIQKVKMLKENGIDAINVPDGPRASARMSAMLTSVIIEQKAGIESVLHYTCRDRNLLGMQSDILGAQAIGLKNLLLVTGDPPKMGSYPDATGVFDVDAIGLTNLANRLNHGIDLGKKDIGTPLSLSLGVGVNPCPRYFDYEMKRFKWKYKAGAEWAITQPVFEVESLKKLLTYMDKHQIKLPIIAGIWPLVSYRNAIFMHNEVPGITIPENILEKMSHVKDSSDAKKVGIEIAQKMVAEIEKIVQGIQVSAPFGNAALALKVLSK